MQTEANQTISNKKKMLSNHYKNASSITVWALLIHELLEKKLIKDFTPTG